MTPFIGQVDAFAFDFAPLNWAPCDGRVLKISENVALFSLLGIKYGGDGMSTFGLPKLPSLGPDGPNFYIALQGEFPPKGT
jgi:microcystin-dependent protein